MCGGYNWLTITEQDWERVFPPPFAVDDSRIIRVYPAMKQYDEIVNLRYAGLVETGFIDPRLVPPSSMALERDTESIILALQQRNTVLATLTLNTITPTYNGHAMMIEKGVRLEHPYFRSQDSMEMCKLVVEPRVRPHRQTLNMIIITWVIAKMLGKNHFWQVSKYRSGRCCTGSVSASGMPRNTGLMTAA